MQEHLQSRNLFSIVKCHYIFGALITHETRFKPKQFVKRGKGQNCKNENALLYSEKGELKYGLEVPCH